MKTVRVEIDEREYILCCPIYVMKELNEHFGGLGKIDELFNYGDLSTIVDESMWILSAFMRAGERYAEKNGIECSKALTVEQLQDVCDIETLFDLRESLFEIISASTKQEIELEPQKENGATPGESRQRGIYITP